MSSQLNIADERTQLSQAFLQAASIMARENSIEGMLDKLCQSIAGASSHIRLVWMLLDDDDEQSDGSTIIAGEVSHALNDQSIFKFALDDDCPTRTCIASWQPATNNIPEDSYLRKEHGLRSVLGLPVGREQTCPHGIVNLYADIPDFFEQIGNELFMAFIQLANAALDQTVLMNSLQHMASYDQLTSILNRRGINALIEKERSRSIRHNLTFAIILIDLDRFKLVNDRMGHRDGDKVLVEVAEIIRSQLRAEDVLGRWGGEEFICLIPQVTLNEAEHLAERIRINLGDTPININGSQIHITASLGVAIFPDDGDRINKLVTAADGALYNAKRSGRNRVVSAHNQQHDIYSIGSMLESALQENRIIPAFQPIIDLASGTIVAEETLARLIDVNGNLIPASKFIESASQLQLLHRIDESILMQAFSHCVAGLQTDIHRIDHFVNISADLLRHQDKVTRMLDAAKSHCKTCGDLISDVKPIVIEITEMELLSDINEARRLLQPFIDFGFRLALDDFGSGYSSYAYLADLPFSFLKIDGTLITRLNEPRVRAIVQGIQDTAQQLGITTIAEFVTTQQQETILKEIGINWAQGYYYAKPATTDLKVMN